MRQYPQAFDRILQNSKREFKMKKVLRDKVPLLTSNGKTMVPIEITYDDSEVIANLQSEITLLFNEIEFFCDILILYKCTF